MKQKLIINEKVYERRYVNACANCSLAPESKDRNDCERYALGKCREGFYFELTGEVKPKRRKKKNGEG